MAKISCSCLFWTLTTHNPFKGSWLQVWKKVIYSDLTEGQTYIEEHAKSSLKPTPPWTVYEAIMLIYIP